MTRGAAARAAALLAAALGAALSATGAHAAELVLPPGAVRTFSETDAPGTHAIATAPFDGAAVPVQAAEGAVSRRVWRIDVPGTTTTGLLAPLRGQLRAMGWDVLLDCVDRACGGFDFRFALDVVPAPAMFVDLADYRYLSAAKGADRLDLLVSLSAAIGYLQLTIVTAPPTNAPPEPPPGAAGPARPDDGAPQAIAAAPGPATDLAASLDRDGHAILTGLDFPPGADTLPDTDYPSLTALAAWMAAHPAASVALVGHTDAQGGAEANVAISRRRADAARRALLAAHAVDPARVAARGLGYFAPIARNDTEAGRAANRRVEAVVTSGG